MKIIDNFNLFECNSFKLNCIADHFCIIKSKEEFNELASSEIFLNNSKIFLWGGSNVLFTEEKYNGLVIKNEIMWSEIIDESDTDVIVKVWGWENRDEFVQYCLEQDRCGMENLISIPGSVGAAPMQNIWAYWVEIKDLIINVEWIDMPSNTSIILANYECNFGYRDSVFKHELKNKFFITHVTFNLKKFVPSTYFPQISYGAIQRKLEEQFWDKLDTQLTPQIIAGSIASIRESKLPNRKEIWTAWSFFKNPIVSKEKYKQLQDLEPDIHGYEVTFEGNTLPMYKLNAGQLIDLAWLKGLQHGNVWTYHKHALVLVNNWWGTWQELVELSERIQKIVKDTFGIEIFPEVNFV